VVWLESSMLAPYIPDLKAQGFTAIPDKKAAILCSIAAFRSSTIYLQIVIFKIITGWIFPVIFTVFADNLIIG
jgi:hypothetical protein